MYASRLLRRLPPFLLAGHLPRPLLGLRRNCNGLVAACLFTQTLLRNFRRTRYFINGQQDLTPLTDHMTHPHKQSEHVYCARILNSTVASHNFRRSYSLIKILWAHVVPFLAVGVGPSIQPESDRPACGGPTRLAC